MWPHAPELAYRDLRVKGEGRAKGNDWIFPEAVEKLKNTTGKHIKTGNLEGRP